MLEFRSWLMWCWAERDPDWLARVGGTTFEEYLALTTPLSWDLIPPESMTP